MRSLAAPVLAAFFVFAPALAADSLTADQVIAKSVDARGGRDAWLAIKSAKLTGTMSVSGGAETPFTLWVKRPTKMRFEITMQGQTMVQAFDGNEGWAIVPFGPTRGRPERLDDERIEQLRTMADFDGPLFDYKAKGNQVKLVGTVDVDGTETYALEVTKASGDVTYSYLDADSFLPLREEMSGEGPDGPFTANVTFTDYEEVAGVLLAHTMEQAVEGSPAVQTITVEDVEANLAVDDAFFAFPGSAAGN